MMTSGLKLNEISEEKKELPSLRFLDKNKAQKSFYHIVHPDKVALLGASYLEDFRKGTKSFAICSTNYKTSQQRTILALASYFEQLFDVNILIVSDTLMKGAFKPFAEAGKPEKITFSQSGLEANYISFYHHFDFISLDEVTGNDHHLKMMEIAQCYDLIFWDTPLLGQHHEAQKILFKIAQFVQSYSLIVPPAASGQAKLGELKKHFDGFGINVNGVLFKEVYKEKG